MIETKSAWQSKTYWKETIGAILLVLVANLGPEFFPDYTAMATSLVGIIFGGAGMVIRNQTDTPITGSVKDPNPELG